MDRRSFFAFVGGIGLAPLVSCEGRDPSVDALDTFGPELDKFRRFIVPEGTQPALAFAPLRQPKS
ncbi:MAG: hypothetical protein ABI867_10665 [Kofleriaceae bacterium]